MEGFSMLVVVIRNFLCGRLSIKGCGSNVGTYGQ